MALTPGIFLVQDHHHWLDSLQIFSGKITVEINTPLGSTRRSYTITAADVVSYAAQVLNILSQLAGTYQVAVDPFFDASFADLSSAIATAQATWPAS